MDCEAFLLIEVMYAWPSALLPRRLDHGVGSIEAAGVHAREMAGACELSSVEIPHSMKDIRSVAQGPWAIDNFVVMKPDRAILASPFLNPHVIRLHSAKGPTSKEDSHASWSPLDRQSKPLAERAPTLRASP